MQNETNGFEEDFEEIVIPEGKTLRTFKMLNSGKPTLITALNLIELSHYSDVANSRLTEDEQSQRPLDAAHANAIALYFLKALLDTAVLRLRKQGKPVNEQFFVIQNLIGKQVYFTIPPLVANLRNNSIADLRRWIVDNEVVGHYLTLKHGDLLWIVDGQHRRRAIDNVIYFLKNINENLKYPAKGGLWSPHKNKLSKDELEVWSECKNMCHYCKIAVEIHLGLDIDQERQLFYDLNMYGKKVDASLGNKFDSSNPINNYVSEVLVDDIFNLQNFTVLDSSTESDWIEENPSISRKSLSGINAILFLNKNNINGATPADLSDYKKEKAFSYWNFVLTIPGFLNSQPKINTVAAQPVVLKAIAKLYYDTFFSKNANLNNEENHEKLIEGLKSFDFTHLNIAWRYYSLDKEARSDHGLDSLSEYLPMDGDGKNRDLGGFDQESKTFRFGSKHNDIYPLIGDIIKWHCKLPTRQKLIVHA